ncbi:PREDICTED: cytochrome c oxidase subunit 7A2, mitochondrial [Thamnophis sirtalis]|uniref:Cytochrome c oxidase subunit 7A2, mitochondrial n=1 Tax=Thamnophis sirtalis TaxID=35019 RepID=A0A6I9YWJ6_9SAUR|nr:PREDICTED: cytochrome c oxidase subunit 7A2, mitochondrial [Thamnophis sirtalis]
MFRTLLAVRQVARNPINFASRRQVASKIAEKQKHFQEDNGVPVYLKNGMPDAVLYRITMALSVVGLGYLFYNLYEIGKPKK